LGVPEQNLLLKMRWRGGKNPRVGNARRGIRKWRRGGGGVWKCLSKTFC